MPGVCCGLASTRDGDGIAVMPGKSAGEEIPLFVRVGCSDILNGVDEVDEVDEVDVGRE